MDGDATHLHFLEGSYGTKAGFRKDGSVVARGRARLEGADSLDAGDAARLTTAGSRRLQATLPAEVLIWEMHTSL